MTFPTFSLFIVLVLVVILQVNKGVRKMCMYYQTNHYYGHNEVLARSDSPINNFWTNLSFKIETKHHTSLVRIPNSNSVCVCVCVCIWPSESLWNLCQYALPPSSQVSWNLFYNVVGKNRILLFSFELLWLLVQLNIVLI